MTIDDAHMLMDARLDEHLTAPEKGIHAFARGLAIIAAHCPDDERYSIAARHDETWFPFHGALTRDELLELNRLGFRVDRRRNMLAKFT